MGKTCALVKISHEIKKKCIVEITRESLEVSFSRRALAIVISITLASFCKNALNVH